MFDFKEMKIKFFSIFFILFNKNFCLWSFDLIADLMIDNSVLNLFAVAIIALVSLGKHEPP